MDTSTGKIYDVEQEGAVEDLERRLGGRLIPIPEQDLATVRAMHLSDRIAWARHRLARFDGETADDHRKVKNALKRQRKEQRNA